MLPSNLAFLNDRDSAEDVNDSISHIRFLRRCPGIIEQGVGRWPESSQLCRSRFPDGNAFVCKVLQKFRNCRKCRLILEDLRRFGRNGHRQSGWAAILDDGCACGEQDSPEDQHENETGACN
jgi:hypothetical protein